jgi:hypothetical protein
MVALFASDHLCASLLVKKASQLDRATDLVDLRIAMDKSAICYRCPNLFQLI